MNAMEQEGLVLGRMADDSGRREKILYHITDQRTEALKAWLKEEQAANDLKYETLLKLWFSQRSLAPSDGRHSVHVAMLNLLCQCRDNPVLSLQKVRSGQVPAGYGVMGNEGAITL